LYFRIRKFFAGNDASDFEKYGDLCVSLICISSEVFLVMLFLSLKLADPILTVQGADIFSFVYNVTLGLACLGMMLRQVRNDILFDR